MILWSDKRRPSELPEVKPLELYSWFPILSMLSHHWHCYFGLAFPVSKTFRYSLHTEDGLFLMPPQKWNKKRLLHLISGLNQALLWSTALKQNLSATLNGSTAIEAFKLFAYYSSYFLMLTLCFDSWKGLLRCSTSTQSCWETGQHLYRSAAPGPLGVRQLLHFLCSLS